MSTTTRCDFCSHHRDSLAALRAFNLSTANWCANIAELLQGTEAAAGTPLIIGFVRSQFARQIEFKRYSGR